MYRFKKMQLLQKFIQIQIEKNYGMSSQLITVLLVIRFFYLQQFRIVFLKEDYSANHPPGGEEGVLE